MCDVFCLVLDGINLGHEMTSYWRSNMTMCHQCEVHFAYAVDIRVEKTKSANTSIFFFYPQFSNYDSRYPHNRTASKTPPLPPNKGHDSKSQQNHWNRKSTSKSHFIQARLIRINHTGFRVNMLIKPVNDAFIDHEVCRGWPREIEGLFINFNSYTFLFFLECCWFFCPPFFTAELESWFDFWNNRVFKVAKPWSSHI